MVHPGGLMKAVGVFRELEPGHDESLPSIKAAAGFLTPNDANLIAAYLENGETVFDVMKANADPFDPSISLPGGPSLVTDGLWVWRLDLAYFVRKYRVELSRDFVSHAVGHPALSQDRQSLRAAWKEVLDTYNEAKRRTRVK